MSQQLNETLAVFLFNDDVRGIRCSYNVKKPNGKDINENPTTYFFKTFDQTIKVDDLVVVPSRGERNAVPFTVIRVAEVDCKAPHKETNIDFKWIVCKFDPCQHDDTLKQEQELFDMMEAKRELKAKIELAEMMGLDESDYSGLSISNTSNALPPPVEHAAGQKSDVNQPTNHVVNEREIGVEEGRPEDE